MSEATSIVRPLRAFVEELFHAGIRHAVICPGSRSTPLALALRAHPGIRTWVQIDERSAAYFALGMAKADRNPVVLLSTSGTAAVNMAPAVVEAFYGRVPLVVLTADRPPELRDRAAPQTIDQTRLYGRHAKWFVDMPLMEPTDVGVAHVRAVAARAVQTAAEAPAGAVHLNMPFRDPLVPDGDLAPELPFGRPYLALAPGTKIADGGTLERLVAEVRAARRGLIVCGPLDAEGFPAAVARLAERLGWPILADPLSQVRSGPHDRSLVVDRYDALVRDPAFVEDHVPDLVIRFGAPSTSKALMRAIEERRVAQVIVDGDGGWGDPTSLPGTFVHADPVGFCDALDEALGPGFPGRGAERSDGAGEGWTAAWLIANETAHDAVEEFLAESGDAFEGSVFAALAPLIPDGATLYVGNSMPVRDLDYVWRGDGRFIRCLANRGANGIDGVVSSALGTAAVSTGPVVLVVGDLSFLHDLNALVAARLHALRITIVVVNNDGGGIFSFLPQADLPAHFEELFGTPHGVDLGPLVAALGASFRRPDAGQLGPALRDALAEPGASVVEVISDRARNVQLHRTMWDRVAAAVAEPRVEPVAAEPLVAGPEPSPAVTAVPKA